MTFLKLISLSSGVHFSPSAFQAVSFRIIYLSFLLFSFLLFELFQPYFTHIPTMFSMYLGLSVLFALNGVFLLTEKKNSFFFFLEGVLFFLESLLFFLIIFYSQNFNPLFFLLFSFNIAICSYRAGTKGGVLMALWSGILLNILFILAPEMHATKFYLGLFLTHVSFFFVAFFSGFLMESYFSIRNQLFQLGKRFEGITRLHDTFVDRVKIGTLIVNGNLEILYSNPFCSTLLGHQSVEGRNLVRFFSEGTVGAFRRILRFYDEDVGFSRKAHSKDVTYHHPKLGQRILSVTLSPMEKDKDFCLLLEDVTERKKQEEKGQQEEKMKVLGELASGIAHEIRNPLSSIIGSLEVMGQVSPEEQKKLKEITLKESRRLGSLINDLLTYVRPEKAKKEEVDLNRLLKEVLSFVKLDKTLRSDVKQVFKGEIKKSISGDPDQLKQAFTNILVNAYHALESKDSPEIFVEIKGDEKGAVVVIRDNGKGMSEESRRKIFEPFFTTKAKGTGLGLAITYRILQNHKVFLEVTSKEGEGTQFEIKFPFLQDFYQEDL